MSSNDPVKLEELEEGSSEYTKVQTNFKKGIGKPAIYNVRAFTRNMLTGFKNIYFDSVVFI